MSIREKNEQTIQPAPRTLDDVKSCLARDKPRGVDASMARLMLRHGNLTDEAREYLKQEYPQ